MAARGRPPNRARKREDADAGVERCLDLMTSGRWITGRSVGILALEYGVSPKAVESWATTASRMIRLSLANDREELRARMMATLDFAISKCATKGDYRTVVSAVGEQAKILGLISQRVDVTTRPSLIGKPKGELVAEMESLKAEIEAEMERVKSDDGP